jgi:hypothetical protein
MISLLRLNFPFYFTNFGFFGSLAVAWLYDFFSNTVASAKLPEKVEVLLRIPSSSVSSSRMTTSSSVSIAYYFLNFTLVMFLEFEFILELSNSNLFSL